MFNKSLYKTISRFENALIKPDRGAMTLEAAILAPLVIFTACLLLYMVVAMFEQAQAQSSAAYAAQRVSPAWRGAVVGKGASAGLYHRIYDPAAKIKLEMTKTTAETRFYDTSLPGFTRAEGGALHKNGIFGQTLAVELRGRTDPPNEKIMPYFGYESGFNVSGGAVSLVPDFAENIRCMRYALEIEKSIEEASPEFAKIAGAFPEVLERIKSFVGGLL